jgi:hypothetical protein
MDNDQTLQSRWQRHPAALTLLFCEAFRHLATWLRSQVGQGTRTLETVLNVTFRPSLARFSSPADRPHSWDILFYLVRRSDNPWRMLLRLLPGEETWEICAGLLKRYLEMPEKYVTENILVEISIQY